MTDLEHVIRDLAAGTLNKHCLDFLNNSKLSTFETGLILGIIIGVEDDASYDKKISIPSTVSTIERIHIISNYIQKNPKRQLESFASLAFDAMIEQWPYPH
jgi:hypothetical protein